MDAAAWTIIRAEFARIDEAPESERAALLAALPGDIRTEVESLLASLGQAGGFLDLPDGPAPAVGAFLGPYALREEIGRGGMGVVYRASRIDGELDRDVAIKIATGRLSGADVARRFVQERQILAGLDHPHIVRLIDAGIAAGHRYVVMELASGIPITEFAATIDVTRRLRLFTDVCGAIHHAHQRLVLHRDLKPANIIVTDAGAVKVLDFGIAQILRDDSAAGAGMSTALHPMSYGCASPEQLRGEPLSLASDIYSLGVLLYELVAGQNPQYRQGATFEETYRRVVNEPLVAPSRRATGLPRDLDAVVLKALAREPKERYASVAEFQVDIERLLTGRPVLAHAPSALYVFGKLVRRHKAITALAAGLVLAIGVGAGVYIRQARIERRRFEDARQLVHTVIFDIQPKMESIAGTLPLRKTLIESTMTYLEAVSKDAGDNVPLLLELSNAYQQLARVSGDISTSTLGRVDDAQSRFAKAEALMARATALAPNDPAVLKDAALLNGRLSTFENGQSRTADALRHAQAAVDYARRNVEARPAGDFDAREIYGVSISSLALGTPAEDWKTRVKLFEQASDLYAALAKEKPEKENLRRNTAVITRLLASLNRDKAELPNALKFGGRSVEIAEQMLAAKPADPGLQLEVVASAFLLAAIHDDGGNADEAEKQYGRAIALADGVLASDPGNARASLFLAEASANRSLNRLRAGDRVAARMWSARSVGVFDDLSKAGKLPEVGRWRHAEGLSARGDVARADGQTAKACDDYRRAVEMFDAVDRQSPLTDLVKSWAERTRASLAACGDRRLDLSAGSR